MRTIPLVPTARSDAQGMETADETQEGDDLVLPNRSGWCTGHDNMVKRTVPFGDTNARDPIGAFSSK